MQITRINTLEVIRFIELFLLLRCDKDKVSVYEKLLTVLPGSESEMVGNQVTRYITLSEGEKPQSPS
jgi:hypothetical protein